nr:DUF547 domain-containing protein [uncultured Allomuricauda sp.]
MNLLLNVVFGLFLLTCNGKVEKQPQIKPESNTPISILVEEEMASIANDSLPEPESDTAFETAPAEVKPEATQKKVIVEDTPLNDEIWGHLLKKHVDDKGNVNYIGFKGDINELEVYLSHMAQNPPKSVWSKNEKLAYYINLYNAATVKLIVDHYPVKSIKDIPNRWKKKWIKVGDGITSLNDIEHEVLRQMNEPRIHFAINCASYSCPKLLNIPFTPQSMERLLSKTAVDFVNDKSRNRFENGSAQLSRIFKWYKGDFTEDTTLLEYINQYLENPVDKNAKVVYLDYDWSLNETE